MSDKNATPAAEAAAGNTLATAAAAEIKTAATELKAVKKELAESVKRVAALEGENSRLHNEIDNKDEQLLVAGNQVRELLSEIEVLKALPVAEDNRILYTSIKGDTYEVIHPTFKFKGSEYAAAELIEEGDTEILEQLIEAKAFILKKV